MPTAHETVVYDVHDFKVWALLTDSVSGSPTYDAAVDVPGVAEVSFDPNFIANELKGDAKIIAKKGRIDKFNFSATYGRVALDALEVFMGGTVSDGSGFARWRFPASNSLPYFKAAFQISDAEVGDVHVTGFKCQVTGGTLLNQSSDEFGQPTIEFEAIPTSNDSLFVDIEFFDAVTPLS